MVTSAIKTSCVILACIVIAFCQEIVIHYSNGETESFPIQNVTKLTFSDIASKNQKNSGKGNQTEMSPKILSFDKQTGRMKVRFTLKTQSDLHIMIMNTSGQTIAGIVMPGLNEGTHTREWTINNKGAGAPAGGIYTLAIETNNESLYTTFITVR